MKKFNLILFIILLTFPITSAGDQLSGTCEGINATILWYGLAKRELKEEKVDEIKVASDATWTLKNIRLIEKTERIPIKDGSIMYLSAEIQNLPIGETLKGFRWVKKFPPSGMTLPKTGKTFYSGEGSFSIESKKSIKKISAFWTFKDKYAFEMVPGKWIYQLWYKDCLLIEKNFIAFKDNEK
jgi:hypothetical protein